MLYYARIAHATTNRWPRPSSIWRRGDSLPVVCTTVDVSIPIGERSRRRAITDPQEKALSASRGETGTRLAHNIII